MNDVSNQQIMQMMELHHKENVRRFDKIEKMLDGHDKEIDTLNITTARLGDWQKWANRTVAALFTLALTGIGIIASIFTK